MININIRDHSILVNGFYNKVVVPILYNNFKTYSIVVIKYKFILFI